MIRHASSGPTPAHREALDIAAAFLSGPAEVDAVLLVGSWARELAHEESDLDLAVLAHTRVEAAWEESDERRRAEALLRPLARWATVEVESFTPELRPEARGWTSGPDDFQLRIGNWIAYAKPDLAAQLAAALDIDRVREGAATVEALLDEYVKLESPLPAA